MLLLHSYNGVCRCCPRHGWRPRPVSVNLLDIFHKAHGLSTVLNNIFPSIFKLEQDLCLSGGIRLWTGRLLELSWL